MKKILLALIALLVVIVAGCDEGDWDISEGTDDGAEAGVSENSGTMGGSLETENSTAVSCPDTCDDGNACTKDSCSEETGFACTSEPIVPCCGNSECEKGEAPDTCASDCKGCTEDPRKCYEAVFDSSEGKCVTRMVSPCCGNGICDFRETCSSCDEDCGSCDDALSLSDYPGMLGSPIYIVVGSKGTGDDVFAASAIATALTAKRKTVENKFSDDLTKIGEEDSILVGGPCTAPIFQELFGLDDCTDFLEENQAVIKVMTINSHTVIAVAGHTSKDTRTASKMLSNIGAYAMAGEEVLVDTSGSEPKRI